MLLENVRLSFPSLFQATSFQPDQPKRFQATFIIPKDSPNVKKIQAEIERVATEKWGPKAKSILAQLRAQNRLCLRDGAEKAGMDGFGEDVYFISASSDKRPGVYDRDRTPLSQEDGRIYAGCWVNGVIEIWAQDNQYGKRINAQLRGVQFVRDDEAFGGGGAPATADDFPELDDDDSTFGAVAEGDDDWM